MTKVKLRRFVKSWSKADKIYISLKKTNRIMFPEPIQREIAMKYFDTNLLISTSGPYDFSVNVELKSSSTTNGCTPFKITQNNCSRIIYLEIDSINESFNFYDIAMNDVNIVNTKVSSGIVNITLGDFKTNASLKVVSFSSL